MPAQILRTVSCAFFTCNLYKTRLFAAMSAFGGFCKKVKTSKKLSLVILASFTYIIYLQLVLVILDTQLLVLLTLAFSHLMPINETTLC